MSIVVNAETTAPCIRRATIADHADLIPLLLAMHQESAYARIPVELPRLADYLAFCLQEPNHVAFVHLAQGGGVDAFIIGHVRPYFFSAELGAHDDFVYLKPELRGSFVAYRLLKAFKAWAKLRGAKQLWMGTSAGIEVKRTHRWYIGMRFTEIGRLYCQPVDSVT